MRHSLNINGKIIPARAGETLVDAALQGGVLIPHDCATGQCETCRVRVPHGDIDGAGTEYGNTVLACQAKVRGDAVITYEEAPAPTATKCVIEDISALSHNVLQVVVRTSEALNHRPGQYGKLALAGFPAREYSYCEKMDGSSEPDRAVFQIKRLSKGVVSSALGKSIAKGHKGKLTGPFGSAFLRSQETGPLVLAASGTGFAPIWSLARAVTLATPNRPLTVLAGARETQDLYMESGLNWLRDRNKNNITVSTQDATNEQACTFSGLPVRLGMPDQFLPNMNEQTSVHVAGNPGLVERVKKRALAANATCHADPFLPSNNALNLAGRFQRMLGLTG